MRIFIAAAIGLLLTCEALPCYAAPQVIPARILKGAGISVPAPACIVAISLADSAGRPLCLICQKTNGEITVKLNRELLTGQEIERINDMLQKLEEK